MFAKITAWLKTPQHKRMMRRELKRAQRDLVNSHICAEYYTGHVKILTARINRIEKELTK